MTPPAPPRRILFLQGPCSRFWAELAAAFAAAGHLVFKINVSRIDAIFWGRPGAVWYGGKFEDWPAFLAEFCMRCAITDIVYYADRLPYHVTAQNVAARLGLRAVVIENGYLRPDWITVELAGMGVYSRFPNHPDAIRQLAETAPQADLAVRFRHGFFEEMVPEFVYHVGNLALRPLHPHFRSGRYYNALLEFAAGIPHVLSARSRARKAERDVADLLKRNCPFYLAPLQLQGDHQIHANSPYRHLGQMIDEAIASFARHAPPDMRLVFKQHPHDNGWENWPRLVTEAAARNGVGSRVMLVDGGDLDVLLSRAKGCVTVNSTVGLFAMRAGCPTKALGIAIYDMPGLTHQGSLDAFWTNPEPVDPALADAFVRALAARIQVKGSFFNQDGRQAAIQEIVRRLECGLINGPDAEILPPPRLAKARQIGMNLDHASGDVI